jgi:hypothetical protein
VIREYAYKAEVGGRGDIDKLKNALSLSAIDGFELGGVVAGNSTTKHGRFVGAVTDAARLVSQIRNSAEATV